MEKVWLKEAPFAGMTADAFKIGTALTLGWFWVRVSGCSVLYRGVSIEAIDFTNMLSVVGMGALEIAPPSYVQHNNSSTYFYVIRRANICGVQEQTLGGAIKIYIDADGELAHIQPNDIFNSSAKQINGNKIHFVWYYCPIEQKAEPVCFNVYYDGGTGQINYENPIATISYVGRVFYSYRSEAFDAGRYLFVIRAEEIDGIENRSLSQIKIHLDTTNPDSIDILSIETLY